MREASCFLEYPAVEDICRCHSRLFHDGHRAMRLFTCMCQKGIHGLVAKATILGIYNRAALPNWGLTTLTRKSL